MTVIRRAPAPLAGGYEAGGLRSLVGAGISIDAPSCIAPARPVLDALCGWLAAGDAGLARRLIDRCEPGGAECPFDFLRFEAMLQAISRDVPPVLRTLRLLEVHGCPT